MGRKIHPKVFRLATIYSWDSKWFGNRNNYISNLRADVGIREYLMTRLKEASVDHIEIDRNAEKITIAIFTAKPGVVIGRSGAGINDLKKELKKRFYRGTRTNIIINVQEIKNPSLSARVVAQGVAQEIERRLPFRRSMKMARERVMKSGAKGVKIQVSGRLNGADIARKEIVHDGSIPLHNLRADVSYARVPARTIYGAIGIKVWIYRGEVFEESASDKKGSSIEKPKPRKRN
ncbi:30S ribosomal protein S3 [Candidatus Uhrbacteria bacterium]|jgi:small subunit ribosomal protein S3|nr:30S ribosomal protein S3 [Candidatus Uhrbacteria bacterium]